MKSNYPRALIHHLGFPARRIGRASLAPLLHQCGHQVDFFDSLEALLCANRVRKSDCLLLSLPSRSAIDEALVPVLRFDSNWPVICISRKVQLATVVAAMKLGAFHFLLETTPPGELMEVLEEAFAHSRKRQENEQRQLDIQARYEQLTNREREVFHLLITGQPTREIATQLQLAIQTVKIHRARVLAKMGAGSAIELLRFAQILHPPGS